MPSRLLATLIIVACALVAGQHAALAQYPPLPQPFTPPSPFSLNVAGEATNIVAGANVYITATIVDQYGNALAGQVVLCSIASQPGSDASLVVPSAVSDANGLAVVTLNGGTTTGWVVVSCRAGALASQTSVFVYAATSSAAPAGSGSLSGVTFSTNPNLGAGAAAAAPAPAPVAPAAVPAVAAPATPLPGIVPPNTGDAGLLDSTAVGIWAHFAVVLLLGAWGACGLCWGRSQRR